MEIAMLRCSLGENIIKTAMNGKLSPNFCQIIPWQLSFYIKIPRWGWLLNNLKLRVWFNILSRSVSTNIKSSVNSFNSPAKRPSWLKVIGYDCRGWRLTICLKRQDSDGRASGWLWFPGVRQSGHRKLFTAGYRISWDLIFVRQVTFFHVTIWWWASHFNRNGPQFYSPRIWFSTILYHGTWLDNCLKPDTVLMSFNDAYLFNGWHGAFSCLNEGSAMPGQKRISSCGVGIDGFWPKGFWPMVS